MADAANFEFTKAVKSWKFWGVTVFGFGLGLLLGWIIWDLLDKTTDATGSGAGVAVIDLTEDVTATDTATATDAGRYATNRTVRAWF